MAGESFDPPASTFNDADAFSKLHGLFGGDTPATPAAPAPTRIDDDDSRPDGPAGEADGQQAGDSQDPQQLGDEPAADAGEGGDPDAAAAAAQPAEGEQDYEFEGKTYRLPKKLVEGRMRLDDYRAKTEEVANARKLFVAQQRMEKINAEIRAAVAPDVATIQNLDQQIAAKMGQMPDPTVDPVGYLTLDKQVKDLTASRERLRESVLAKGTGLLKQKQDAESDLLRTGNELAARWIPNWSDQKVQAEVVRHALDMGYTVEELNGQFDPRLMRVLHDAAQFRKVNAAPNPATLTQKRVAQAAPTVRPSGTASQAGPRGQIATLKTQATRSGNPEDATAALAAMFRNAGRRR